MKDKSFGPVSESYVVMCAQADAVNEKERPPALNLKRKCLEVCGIREKVRMGFDSGSGEPGNGGDEVNLVFKCVYGCLCVSFYTLDLLVP